MKVHEGGELFFSFPTCRIPARNNNSIRHVYHSCFCPVGSLVSRQRTGACTKNVPMNVVFHCRDSLSPMYVENQFDVSE